MSTRRAIRKISPHRTEYFDSQYWPVLVALVVLSGITAGAILTLLNGGWMWSSLIALAIAVPVTMLSLERVSNQQLRRALQLAIIISMSVHMLILVVASMTDIFGKDRMSVTEPTMKRPERVILISKRTQPNILEKVNKHDVTDPEIEVEKQPTTNQTQPQEIPVKPDPKKVDKQITRSATRSQSVPRFDESLSKLSSSTDSRRQNNSNNMPKTSQQVSKTSAQPSETAKASEAAPNDAVAAANKTSQSQASASAPEISTDPSTSAPKVNRSAQRRKTESSASESSTPSQSTARIRRSSTSMPSTSAKSPVKNTNTATSSSPSETAPRDVTDPVTQRERTSVAERRPLQDLPTRKNTASEQVTKSSTRRTQPTPTPPSIAQPTSNPVNPRRSRRSAEIASSPKAVEAPSAATTSGKTGDSRIQPTASSVTMERSTAVGVGASKNVSVNSGSIPSTAVRASDSAVRKQTTSNDSQPSLTSVQKSNIRRSVANTLQVESALKANTSKPSKVSGSSTPSSRTATASAATVDSSASTAHRAEISAQKGQSQIDMGATKIVTESTSQKRSGGGQPNVENLEMEQVSRARKSTGSRTPSIDASRGLEVASPTQPNSQPISSDSSSPEEQAVVANRTTGNDSISGEPTETTRQGPDADHIAAELDGLLADDRQRRSRDTSDAADSEEDEDEEEQRGNKRTRLTQAPKTGSTTNFAANDTEQPSSSTGSISQSLATAAEIAMNGRGSISLAPTAGRALLKAATSLPLITNGSAERRSNANSANSTSEAELASSSKQRSSNRGSGSGLSTKATEVAGGAPSPGQNREGNQKNAAESMVEVERGDRSGSIELQVDASPGPAGLAAELATRVGIKARPATRDSDNIEADIQTRFKRDNPGGSPSLSRDAVVAKEAFRGRMQNPGGGGPKTEAAIELGLEFLNRNQQPDGSWTLGGLDQTNTLHQNQLDSDTAATGLAMLAYQGAGYNHREFKYANQLNHAMDWMIANQDSDGCLYVTANKNSDDACRMYSHAIATLALTEAYGMTQDAKLVEPINEAIRYIAETQDPKRGGWRYFAKMSKRKSDTSVTGWMLMALQSARLSEFEVPKKVFKRIEDWLDIARDVDSPSLFRYNPDGKDTDKLSRQEGRKVSPTMTSVGLLMRLYMGWNRSDSNFQNGADYLLNHLPSDNTVRQRDTYYWYYATQVMRHAGGPHWEKWNEKLHPLLVNSQMQNGPMAGSWHPYLPVPDRWGHAGGRLYVTTMNLLSLEVNYRLLPLYDETSK